MAKKEDLFGKLNMKDYNNKLEEVLEGKDFSGDTKNFLLSMLYKVETAYNDYYIVKSLNKTKGEFIEEIIETIQYNCDKIELIKPLDKKYSEFIDKKEKCIVNKDKKEIISIYNEQYLLYAIFKLSDNNYKFKHDTVKEPLQQLFETGRNINAKEVLRDFDGWTWNVEARLIENIEYNLVFQNLIMLIGEDVKTEEQIKANLNRFYKKEKVQEIYILICQIALLLYLKNKEKEVAKYIEQKSHKQSKLEQMEDKVNYLKNITTKRKKVEERIKQIDKCLSDTTFLKKEYIKINEKLEEDKKIFSVSDFVDIIQNEKNVLICDMQKYNQKMLPANYIKEKEELKESIQILEALEGKQDVYEYILKLQQTFIQGMQEKIKQIQTRSDVMEIIYKLRYYKFLPYKNIKIKDVKELQESIYITEEMIYNIAYKMNVINPISVNEKINNDVIRQILDINIIELENIELLFKAENYQIVLKVFDEENIEKTIEYDTIEGLTARMNKKFRLFIK